MATAYDPLVVSMDPRTEAKGASPTEDPQGRSARIGAFEKCARLQARSNVDTQSFVSLGLVLPDLSSGTLTNAVLHHDRLAGLCDEQTL